MSREKIPVKVFSAAKIHAKIRITRLTAEVAILLVVLVGTAITLFWPSNFSLQQTFENLKTALSLEKVETRGLSFEDQVRVLVDGKVIDVVSIEKSPHGYVTIKDKNESVVIFSSGKELETQVRTLQTLLTKAKIEKRVVSLVDFRFEKLVVRYK
ncbi:MAG: hypothetical protein A2Z24_01325 [Candidatus Woykebacteria bacterium RBG_16_44_10]|uniref:POTRA domain-containing protein n=1 Tax=Candidatus Woykebacteria bacterium RBG_16_44_10 TaxID=1802597 RepID=A0A1G1WEQ7_9BACT|nr:MAG: hypothetical protein A2Z24_01325 [Candidatus Woykebacteria bacterium RBG_16_44_10]